MHGRAHFHSSTEPSPRIHQVALTRQGIHVTKYLACTFFVIHAYEALDMQGGMRLHMTPLTYRTSLYIMSYLLPLHVVQLHQQQSPIAQATSSHSYRLFATHMMGYHHHLGTTVQHFMHGRRHSEAMEAAERGRPWLRQQR
jgi:hypothetical protein